MSNDYISLIKYFPQVSDQLGVIVLVLLVTRVVGKTIGFYGLLARPLDGKS